ncbi:hypothetical protein DFQ28_009292 [Apophysomyces sp. BC1034]|nr:hypothetical protein DFQ28_009292 [Apophysomyces sp. BC1034]
MIDTLPNEIIIKIATYLSRKKLCTCLRVCRSWYAAFIPVLYNNVNIQTESQLNQFVETLRSTEETSNPFGHLVRELTLRGQFTTQHIFPLPRLCPFVVELNYGRLGWTLELSKVLQGWKHLKNLGRLAFHYGPREFPLCSLRNRITRLSIAVTLYPEWIDYTAELPYLTELELAHKSMGVVGKLPKVSLCELELLHRALPRLETFSMDTIIIQGEMPEHIMPCSSVRHLRLKDISGRLWGQYFAQKYTNLEKLFIRKFLELLLIQKRLNETEDVSEATFKAQAMTLARSCRRIKSLTTSKFNHSRDALPFFDVFHQIGAPIEHLDMLCSDPPLYAAVIERFCGTLSHVRLSFNRMTFNEIVEPLKISPLLVALELCDDSHVMYAEKAVEVDRILDHWNRLKHLSLTMYDIRLSDSCSTNNQHGLRTLYLEGGIHQDVFPYLSQRCSRLSELDINFGYEVRPPKVIYFPNPNIERLLVTLFELKDYFYKLTWIDKLEQTSEKRKHFAEGYLKDGDPATGYSWMKWFRSDKGDYYFAKHESQCLDTLLDEQCKGCGICDKDGSTTSGRHVVWILCYNVDTVLLSKNSVPSW